MKKTLLCIGLALAFSAQAECIMRTTSLTKVAGKLDGFADIVPMVSNAGNGEIKCSISMRVQYHMAWYVAYGDYTGLATVGTEELCVNAVEIAARQFLASKEAKLMYSDQQMVCSDEAPIKVKSVQKGDVIKLSEVILNPNKPDFAYKGAQCKWFVETTTKGNDLYQWNGVVCRLNPNTDDWNVVDRF